MDEAKTVTREAPTLNRAHQPIAPPAPRVQSPIRIILPGPIVTAYAIRGSTLAALRLAAELTQRGLDLRTAENGERVSKDTIERIEQAGDEVVRVSVESVTALAVALGKTVDDLCR